MNNKTSNYFETKSATEDTEGYIWGRKFTHKCVIFFKGEHCILKNWKTFQPRRKYN
jgi:hypothetical protein